MKFHLSVLLLIVVLFATVSSFPQVQTESDRLTAEALALIGKKDYAAAVELAGRVVKTERASGNSKRLGIALVNLAQIKQLQARQQNWTSTTQSKIGPVTLHQRPPTTDEIDSHYSEAIGLLESLLPTEASAWSAVVFSYGDFLIARQLSLSYETSDFEKVEKLYKSSLDRSSKLQNDTSDLTLAFVLRLADLYQAASEYERAFPYYQRFVKEAGARKNERQIYLVRPLREFVKLFAVSGQKLEAESYAKQITAITRIEERLPVVDIDSRRADQDAAGLLDDIFSATRQGKKTKSVWVNIVVDKNGKVAEAVSEPSTEIDGDGKQVTEAATRKVRSWKFKPLKMDGVRRETHGRVLYTFVPKG